MTKKEKPMSHSRSKISVSRSPRPEVRRNRNHRDSSLTRSRRSHRDYFSLLKYFFKDTIYFIMKSNNHENIVLSKARGVWSTPPQNEHKLNRAFKEFRNVLLIFSIKESGKFQGQLFVVYLTTKLNS